MQTLKYQIGKTIGVLFIFMGAVFVSVIFIGIFGNDPERDSIIAGGFMLGVLPLLGGILLFRSSRNGERKFLLNKYEQEIFKIASQNGGHLTPTELAMKTDLSLKESKKVLETMQIEGYCELKISPNAAIIFYFRELDKGLDKGNNYADSELLS
jgi:apolipoprotein N-acyltransferase